MSATLTDRGAPAAPVDTVTVVDVVVPVHDEAHAVEGSVRRLHAYLREHLPFSFRVTVVDNASSDGTWQVVTVLADELPEVRAIRLEVKGRGRALREAWTTSDALVLAYMDVDLSTDLAAVLPLVAPLVTGHSDLAIGTRLARGSRIVRGPKREVISRCYNGILRTTLRARFSDAQCGFKAIRADVARALLPFVEDQAWFFDTELLVLAERSGLRIHEVPVDWVDDLDSRVDIVDTALKDLQGVLRLGRGLLTGRLPLHQLREDLGRPPLPGVPVGMGRQLLRFGAIGALSTLAYLVLYLALRDGLGAQAANLVALLVTAMANTAANRRITFGVRGRAHAARSQVEGLVVLGLGLALTSGSLALLSALSGHPRRVVEIAVLVAANATATLLRFVLLRAWVFHPRQIAVPTALTPVSEKA
jgi:putative flippase GtrA